MKSEGQKSRKTKLKTETEIETPSNTCFSKLSTVN